MTTQAIPTTNTAGLPTGTRAAVLHGARDLRIEHKPLPTLGPHDLLVEMRSGGICGSDMHYFADGRNGTNVLRQPTVLGHEGAGVVIAAGPQATVAAGTAVVIEPALPCRECPTCLSGRYNLCPAGTCFGSPPTDGLFARHVVVPEAAVHRLPDTIPAEIGAAIEPLAVAVWAEERAQVRKGHRVLITGAGPIGLLVAQVAAAQGAAEIVVTDVNDDRLAVAAKFGATQTINTATTPLDLAGMDRLIECSGNTRALAEGIQTLAPATPRHRRRPGQTHRGRHPARVPPALRNRPHHRLPLRQRLPDGDQPRLRRRRGPAIHHHQHVPDRRRRGRPHGTGD
jgi:L-iditol 2-dehydrogenase